MKRKKKDVLKMLDRVIGNVIEMIEKHTGESFETKSIRHKKMEDAKTTKKRRRNFCRSSKDAHRRRRR